MNVRLPLLLLTGLLGCLACSARAGTLEAFTYPSDRAAAKAWKPGPGAPAPTMEKAGGMALALPFSKGADRFYWDRDVRLNLSSAGSFRLELDCARPAALRGLSVYFKSGAGWYVWSAAPSRTGRQVVQVSRSRCSVEGKPAGWHRIEQIRIAPWKGEAVDNRLVLYSLRADNDRVVVVQGTVSVQGDSEKNAAQHVANRISQWLGEAGIGHAVLRDEDVNDRTLSGAKVAILGYNYTLPTGERDALGRFIQRGGKLIVCFSKDAGLAALMGLKVGPYQGETRPGQFSAIVFSDPAALSVPEKIYQRSWNIRPALPVSAGSRVIATWADAAGNVSRDPAWTESPHGMWMSHILLGGDGVRKRRMLLGLVGHYLPEVWEQAARRALAGVGQIDSYRNLEQALADLGRNARRAVEPGAVLDLLEQARDGHREAADLIRKGRFHEAYTLCESLNTGLTRAYGMVQQPRKGELRGVWDHEGTGWYPGDWDRSCRALKAAGFNTVYANWMWGGLAHYPGKVLPVSATVRMHGDQVAQAVRAGQRHGIAMHLWIVCWNVKNAPETFRKKLEAEGRLQVDLDGKVQPWLNPAHPANTQLAVQAVREAATRYPGLAGVHLDYIRYPGNNLCFSSYSRKRFEAWLGRKVADWPKDAANGGRLASAYRRFRVDQINLFVRAIRKELQTVNPKMQLSAAVFGKYPSCVDSVAQDWQGWLKRGEVDYVCPMNYTEDLARFNDYVRTQTAGAPAAARIVPGIGVTASESELTADLVIEQILAARHHRTGGFVLFKLDRNLKDEILPVLQLGTTR